MSGKESPTKSDWEIYSQNAQLSLAQTFKEVSQEYSKKPVEEVEKRLIVSFRQLVTTAEPLSGEIDDYRPRMISAAKEFWAGKGYPQISLPFLNRIIDFFRIWTEIDTLNSCLIREPEKPGQDQFFHQLDFFHRHPFERDIRNLLNEGTKMGSVYVLDRSRWISEFFRLPMIALYGNEALPSFSPPEGDFVGPLDAKILSILLTEGVRKSLQEEGKPYVHVIKAHPLRETHEDRWEGSNIGIGPARQYWHPESLKRRFHPSFFEI